MANFALALGITGIVSAHLWRINGEFSAHFGELSEIRSTFVEQGKMKLSLQDEKSRRKCRFFNYFCAVLLIL